jgi:FO synthase
MDLGKPGDAMTQGRPSTDTNPSVWTEQTIGFDILERPLAELCSAAAALRDEGWGALQTYSPKVFIPLTHLCRNRCGYCTFSMPSSGGPAFMSVEAVLEVARKGAAAGCSEALFTLGDKPELRYPSVARELEQLGFSTTIDYLVECCRAVRDQTGLLPHVNAGVMGRRALARLREASVSQGLMVENTADRLLLAGGPHWRSPDKAPRARLATIAKAGELSIPFTTGLLIGIGETRAERLETLVAIRTLHERYGHIQEVIVQNFRAQPHTAMAQAAEPSLDDLLWTIAAARLILGPGMSIQTPPNLTLGDDVARLLDAGINDWGGISPVTIDHVNPGHAWPTLRRLQSVTESRDRRLAPRLPIYPGFAREPSRWLSASNVIPVLRAQDASQLARGETWFAGLANDPPIARLAEPSRSGTRGRSYAADIAFKALEGEPLDEAQITALFEARGVDVETICETADALRQRTNGDAITFVVNRNINYTNVCSYKCSFCAFSKGRGRLSMRGPAYDLGLEEIVERGREARARGATELCLQGGIHPHYTGRTYLEIVGALRSALPDIHIHAFSPLEVQHGASTLSWSIDRYLDELAAAGLNSLPGTAAEILDDEVRQAICPDKLTTAQWNEVIEAAHGAGLKTTSTIMFGHIEQPGHWARHLLRLRDLAARTGGITEFVPLPFVHMAAPMSVAGKSRLGPTFREVRLMHAVARLVLDAVIPSIQTSWVKLGPAGAKACLEGGANDLGGTLMNESISRAAGAAHGQELTPEAMCEMIAAIGRRPRQRTTLYRDVDPTLASASISGTLETAEAHPIRSLVA